jgi:hypothetical protein
MEVGIGMTVWMEVEECAQMRMSYAEIDQEVEVEIGARR